MSLASGLLGGEHPAAPTDAQVGNLEGQVKAAFIVKFAAFVEWPSCTDTDTNAPFVIGILGQDAFGTNLDEAVKLERVKGRPVEVRRATQLEKLVDCEILFVASSETKRLGEIISRLGSRPVLVITDEPGAAQRGSAINFYRDNGKVRFEFNLAAADKAQLKVSAKLLQAGRIAVPARAPEGRSS